MLSSLGKKIKCVGVETTDRKIKKLTTDYSRFQNELKKLQGKLNKLRGLSTPSEKEKLKEKQVKSINEKIKNIRNQMDQIVDELVNIGYCKGSCMGKKCMDDRRAKVIKLLKDNTQSLKF